jgi:hypothetical protein
LRSRAKVFASFVPKADRAKPHREGLLDAAGFPRFFTSLERAIWLFTAASGQKGEFMEPSQSAWRLLAEAVGAYEGRGINHEKQAYRSSFRLTSAVPEKLFSLSSVAIGESGETFHHEVSWIGCDLSGILTLFVVSNNHPAVTPHVLDRIEKDEDRHSLVFRFGDIMNTWSFREEVTISLHADSSISHHYAWGLPGGAFAPRSGSEKMKRTEKFDAKLQRI